MSNTGNYNTGNRNTGNCNTGNCNTGNCNTGNRNTGSWNTGSWNTGSWNTGYFCENEGKLVLFDKETSMSRSEFKVIINSLSSLPMITEWIDANSMTAKEKQDNPNYETTGGYLKKFDYKDAHRIWWSRLGEADRQKILTLPNFDAAKFERITGIDINQDKITKDSDKLSMVKSKIEQLEAELRKLKDELK